MYVLYLCVYGCVNVCMYVCMYVDLKFMYVCKMLSSYVCVLLYVCMYVCMYCRDKSATLVTAITAKSNIQLVDIISTRMLGQYGFLSKVRSTYIQNSYTQNSIHTYIHTYIYSHTYNSAKSTDLT